MKCKLLCILAIATVAVSATIVTDSVSADRSVESADTLSSFHNDPPIYDNGSFFLPGGIAVHFSSDFGFHIFDTEDELANFLVVWESHEDDSVQFRAFSLNTGSFVMVEADISTSEDGSISILYDLFLENGGSVSGSNSISSLSSVNNGDFVANGTSCECVGASLVANCSRVACQNNNSCDYPYDNRNCDLVPKRREVVSVGDILSPFVPSGSSGVFVSSFFSLAD